MSDLYVCENAGKCDSVACDCKIEHAPCMTCDQNCIRGNFKCIPMVKEQDPDVVMARQVVSSDYLLSVPDLNALLLRLADKVEGKTK